MEKQKRSRVRQAKRVELTDYIYLLCAVPKYQIKQVLDAMPMALAALVNEKGSCHLKEIGLVKKVVLPPRTYLGYSRLKNKPVSTRKGPRTSIRVDLTKLFKLRAGGLKDYSEDMAVHKVIERIKSRKIIHRINYKSAKM